MPSTTAVRGYRENDNESSIPRSVADFIRWMSFVRSAKSDPKNICGSGSELNTANGMLAAGSLFTIS